MEPDPLRGAHSSDPTEGSRHQGAPESSQVRVDDLRELLDVDRSAQLVLQGGRVRVVPADDASALPVITREDLADRLGERADDEAALKEVVVLLNTEIRQLGS